MNGNLRTLPIRERIRIVEDLWDSIASDQKTLPLSAKQKAEIDKRLSAYEVDKNPGRLATDALTDILRKL